MPTPRISFADLPHKRQGKARDRLAVVEAVEARRRGQKLTRPALAALLAEVSVILGLSAPVSVASFYRWRAAAQDQGAVGLIGGKQGPQSRRVYSVRDRVRQTQAEQHEETQAT